MFLKLRSFVYLFLLACIRWQSSVYYCDETTHNTAEGSMAKRVTIIDQSDGDSLVEKLKPAYFGKLKQGNFGREKPTPGENRAAFRVCMAYRRAIQEWLEEMGLEANLTDPSYRGEDNGK